jgi:hypothetical protein
METAIGNLGGEIRSLVDPYTLRIAVSFARSSTV